MRLPARMLHAIWTIGDWDDGVSTTFTNFLGYRILVEERKRFKKGLQTNIGYYNIYWEKYKEIYQSET